MSLLILQDLGLEQRRAKLKEMAKVTDFNTSYQRTLSQAEVDAEKDRFTRGSIEKERLQEEAKKAADSFKAQVNAQEDKLQSSLTAVKTGKIEVQGDLYGIANYEEKRMCYYDIYGEMIYSRDLTPADGQGDIFKDQKPKAGTTPLGVANDVMNAAAGKAEDPKGKDATAKATDPPKEGEKATNGPTNKPEDKKPGTPAKTQAELQKENADKNLNAKKAATTTAATPATPTKEQAPKAQPTKK